MDDTHAALDAVIQHAVELEDDYDDIEPSVTALSGSGDSSLVPRLHQALETFLDERNFYGRDLIAGILAGVEGVASLPVLLRAAARDLGDDQDGLQTEIVDLLTTDRAASRSILLDLLASGTPELRTVVRWALEFTEEPPDDEARPAS